METKRIKVIDSHTAGEPTRVVLAGGPDVGRGSLEGRLALLRDHFDWLRTAVVNEPRGSEVMVGALVCEPVRAQSTAAVIFFNNVGYLRMCGHGTIGLVVSLAHVGRLGPGRYQLESVAGDIFATLHDENNVSVENVPSYRYRKDVAVMVPDMGTVVGDIAWGGNWFFLVSDHKQILDARRADSLTQFCSKIRSALKSHGITGQDGSKIDHIQLVGPPTDAAVADAQNFVLCPGNAYDRSPCGTGTSAKLACLAADGVLGEGQLWRQQSLVGSVFEAKYRKDHSAIIPTITGAAYVNAEATLIINPRDPFSCGIDQKR